MTGRTGLAVSRDVGLNGTLPQGHRLAIGSLLSKQTTGQGVRQGIMWDGGGAVVSGTAGMNYSIRACAAVVMPSAIQGPVITANDAALLVATTAAPGANSRYDIVWVRQHLVVADGGADADVISEWGCTQGVAAAVPALPAIPAGAVGIAVAQVGVGVVATNALAIANYHNWCAAAGAPIPVRDNTDRNALTAFDGLLVNNLTSKKLEKYNGTLAAWETVWSGDSGWVAVAGTATYVSTLRIRKEGTRVTAVGYLTRAAGFAIASAGVIPVGYRPSTDLYLPTGQPAAGIGARMTITAATGDIQVTLEAASPGNGIGINAVWYTD